MKRLFPILFCACSTTTTAKVEIAALPPSGVVPVHDEVAVPGDAKRVIVKEDGAWAAAFAPSKTFATYDLPDARRVVLTWRIGPHHAVKQLEDDEDYPSNHVAPIDLVVSAKGDTRTIAFGELSGSVVPYWLSWCKVGDRESRAFAATFAMGTPQGDDEFAIVRDGRILHVLHRQTSDGKCDEARQGPLDICDGFEWERVADLRMTSDPQRTELWEIATNEGKPFDCDTE